LTGKISLEFDCSSSLLL